MPKPEDYIDMYEFDPDYIGPGAESTEGEYVSALRAANSQLAMTVQLMFQYIIYLSQGGFLTRSEKKTNGVVL